MALTHNSIFLLSATVALLTLAATSCNQKSESQVKVSTFPSDIFSSEIKLSSETIIDGDEFICGFRYYVYRDSILIIENKPISGKDYYVEIRNFKDKQLISSLFHKGNGPDELIICSTFLYGDELYVRDFAKNIGYIVNLPDLLAGNSKAYTSTSFGEYSQGFYHKGDGHFLLLNPFYFSNKDMRIDNHEPRFLEYPKEKPAASKGRKVYAANVEQGQILVNETDGRIYLFHTSRPDIEIYNSDLELIEVRKISTTFKPEYVNVDGSIVYYKHGAYATVSIAYDDSYIYLDYIGEFLDGGEEKMHSHIIVLDWDCNFVTSYFNDNFMSRLSLSSTPGVFYSSGIGDNGYVLRKLTIN